MFGLVNNMLFPDTHYGGTNTGHFLHSRRVSGSLFVCLAVEAKKTRVLTQPAAIQLCNIHFKILPV